MIFDDAFKRLTAWGYMNEQDGRKMMEEANRMTRIREKLREKEKAGLLGVTAAASNLGEGMLYSWLRNPVYAPSRREVDMLERVLFPAPIPQTGDAAADTP